MSNASPSTEPATTHKKATYKPPVRPVLRLVEELDRHGITANQLCWHRIKMAPFMGVLMAMTLLCTPGPIQMILFVGTLLFCTEVWLTDLWDGHLARIQQKRLCEEKRLGYFTLDPLYTLEFEQMLPWKRRLRLPGITHMGQTIDPVGDKESYLFCALPLLLVPAYADCWKLMVATFIYEFSLYLMRPIKNWLKLNDKAAKGPGKLKVNVEWIALAILFILAAGNLGNWWYIDNTSLSTTATVLFCIILVMQTASFGAHLLGGWRSYQYKEAKKIMARIRGEAS